MQLAGQETTQHSGFLHASFQQGAKHQSWHRTVPVRPKQGCKEHVLDIFDFSFLTVASVSCRSCLHDKFVIKYLQLSRCETSEAFESSLFLQICNALHYNMICKVSKLRYILCMYSDINLLFPRVSYQFKKHPWIFKACPPQRICHTPRYPAQCPSTPWSWRGSATRQLSWLLNHRENADTLGIYPKNNKKYLYMGLNFQGIIVRVPPFSLWTEELPLASREPRIYEGVVRGSSVSIEALSASLQQRSLGAQVVRSMQKKQLPWRSDQTWPLHGESRWRCPCQQRELKVLGEKKPLIFCWVFCHFLECLCFFLPPNQVAHVATIHSCKDWQKMLWWTWKTLQLGVADGQKL